MNWEVIAAVVLPFLGTVLGAAGVFFMRGAMHRIMQRSLTGFAAGVMTAASVWSLIIPGIDQSAHLGDFAFFPAFVGVWAGFLFLLGLDKVIPHLHLNSTDPEGAPSPLGKNTMLVLAVALHNLPEGMAVGVVVAGVLAGSSGLSMAGVLALAVGIALQNVPEGAAVSLPLMQEGATPRKAFTMGAVSGLAELVFGCLVVLMASWITPFMPWLLAFSAGAMMYVVVEELIPEANLGEHSNIGTMSVMVGFLIMMILDCALG